MENTIKAKIWNYNFILSLDSKLYIIDDTISRHIIGRVLPPKGGHTLALCSRHARSLHQRCASVWSVFNAICSMRTRSRAIHPKSVFCPLSKGCAWSVCERFCLCDHVLHFAHYFKIYFDMRPTSSLFPWIVDSALEELSKKKFTCSMQAPSAPRAER